MYSSSYDLTIREWNLAGCARLFTRPSYWSESVPISLPCTTTACAVGAATPRQPLDVSSLATRRRAAASFLCRLPLGGGPQTSRSLPLETSEYRRLQNVLCLAAAAEDVVSIYSGSLDNTIRYHCAQAAGRALAPDAPYETGHICARTGLALPNLRE